MNRRSFLRGVLGSVLAAPLLGVCKAASPRLYRKIDEYRGVPVYGIDWGAVKIVKLRGEWIDGTTRRIMISFAPREKSPCE